MNTDVVSLPDTFGLPEYFITDVVTEIDGPNVRMVCGVRRGGSVHWLYSCVMQANRLVVCTTDINSTAQEAHSLEQLFNGARQRSH